MILPDPKCSPDKRTPCTPKDWVQCDRCNKLICDVHGEVIQIWHLFASNYGDYDRLCRPCVELGRYLGDIFLSHNEYANY
jgi:hypothetical protein